MKAKIKHSTLENRGSFLVRHVGNADVVAVVNADKRGMIISVGGSAFKMGEIIEDCKTAAWMPFYGEITLTND